jgi:hypothetical protein
VFHVSFFSALYFGFAISGCSLIFPFGKKDLKSTFLVQLSPSQHL